MSEDKEFVTGLFVYPPREEAPDYVKCNISINRKDLGNWLRGKTDERINIDVKESRGGKWYAEVSKFKPKKQEAEKQKPEEESDIPF